MRQVILYSTLGCHLCEQALEIVSPLLDKHAVYLEEIDVSSSLELVARYGLKIPVLKLENNNELEWPFDSQQVDLFLAD